MSVFRQRGFAAHKVEDKKRKDAGEAKRGKLYRFFMKDGEIDIPAWFLTDQPILFYEHKIKNGTSYDNRVCTGDDTCEDCSSGDKPSYAGAWLITDGREFEGKVYDKSGKDTGKKEMKKDRLKLFVRGSTDIAKLDLKNTKFGLTTRPWFISKTGTGQSTSYDLERGEVSALTKAQMDKLMEQMPAEYKKYYVSGSMDSLLDIVEYQIFGLPEEEEKPATKSPRAPINANDDEELDDGVQSLDDEEPAKPTRKMLSPVSPAKPVLRQPAVAQTPARPVVAQKPAIKPAQAPVRPAQAPANKVLPRPAAKPIIKR